MFELQLKIVTPGAKPFKLGRDEDAGYDIFSTRDVMIPPGTGVEIPTGIATAFPKGYVGLVLDRGSTGFAGIMHRAGVFDSGWRGEWVISLFNSGKDIWQIEDVRRNPFAKAIAQVVFVKYEKEPYKLVTEMSESLRGDKAFGSTND
jgi:dUTP pyrophosphatase